MTDETPVTTPSVHRLLPSLGDFRTLGLDEVPRRKLLQWLHTGSPTDLPAALTGTWDGRPGLRQSEFPCGYRGAPVLSRRVAEALWDDLTAVGRLLPVHTDTDPPGEDGTAAYLLFAVADVVDCLDTRRSSKPKRMTGEIKKAIFRPEAVPRHALAFRVPEYPGGVYWTGQAVERLSALLGDDLEARLVWSQDPDREPHPNPWGIL